MATCAVILGPSSLVVVALATPPVPCALYHSFTHRVGVELSCWSIGVASSIGSSKWIPCAVPVPIGPVVIAVAAAVPVVVVGSPVGMRAIPNHVVWLATSIAEHSPTVVVAVGRGTWNWLVGLWIWNWCCS